MCDMKLSSPVTNPFICIQILMYFLYALKKQKNSCQGQLANSQVLSCSVLLGKQHFVSPFIVFDRTWALNRHKEQSTYIYLI